MGRRVNHNAKSDTSELPAGVKASDLKRAAWDSDNQISYKELDAMGLEHGFLTFYRCKGMGWVLITLAIAKGRRGNADRSYGITLDGCLCRVGQGPHVEKTVTVYVKKDNVERLKTFIELRTKGLSDAGQTRDRISSRRAEGQLRRARGESSWRWNV